MQGVDLNLQTSPHILKTCTSVASATVPTTGNACFKKSCCNATEREAIDANDSWACPACINLNQNEKESRIYFQKREIVKVSWNPTWEPEELQKTCEIFRQSLNKFVEQITAPNLSQPAPDGHLHDLQKQGFSAIQEDNAYQPYNVDLWNKVSFDIQPTNPPMMMHRWSTNDPTHQPTGWHYGHRALWRLDHKHWSHGVLRKSTLSSPDGTVLPEMYTDTVACIYNVDGKCKDMLTPKHLTYYERPLTGQNAAVYTITSNLLPLALHQCRPHCT